jgi:hypothetical protein
MSLRFQVNMSFFDFNLKDRMIGYLVILVI